MTQNATAWNRRGECSDTTWHRNGVNGSDPSRIDGAHGARMILKVEIARTSTKWKRREKGNGAAQSGRGAGCKSARREMGECYENSNGLGDLPVKYRSGFVGV
jgi:hypothetical protein